jgi:hypothetical protein
MERGYDREVNELVAMEARLRVIREEITKWRTLQRKLERRADLLRRMLKTSQTVH